MLTKAHLQIFDSLDLRYGNIRDLTGIEHLTNLESLNLLDNEITDLSPLLELPHLKTLILSGNPLDLEDSTIQNQLEQLHNKRVDIDIYEVLSSERINLNESYTQYLEGGVSKWYKLTVTEETLINAYSTGDVNLTGKLYDQHLKLLLEQRDGGEGLNFSFYYTLVPGTYYFKLYGSKGTHTFYVDKREEVRFVDDDIERKVRYILSIDDDRPITVRDCLSITELDLSNEWIRMLDGIENLSNLTKLDLNENSLSDISLLTELTQLETLYLEDNQITDLSDLLNMTSLKEVYLRGNPLDLTDLTIQEQLTQLHNQGIYVDLYEVMNASIIQVNHSQSASFIEHNTNWFKLELTEEKHIKIYTTGELDLSWEVYDHQLKPIRIYTHQTDKNFSFAEFFSEGIYYLKVTNNNNTTGNYQLHAEDAQIVTFPDENLARAIRNNLGFHDRPVTNFDCEYQTYLGLYNYDISDLSGIECFVNIYRLDIERNNISDISILTQLPNLELLNLKHNQITDLSPLLEMPVLQEVTLIENPLDITNETIINQLEQLHNKGVWIDIYDMLSAQNITINSVTSDFMDEGKTKWYKFEVTEETTIHIYPTDDWLDLICSLYDGQLMLIQRDDGSWNEDFSITQTLTPGTYYIKIRDPHYNTGDYDLHVEEVES